MDANNEENLKINIYDEEGRKQEYDVLFTFESEEYNKSYMVCKTNEINDDGTPVLKVGSFNPNFEYIQLNPVTDLEELDMVNDVLQEVLEDL